MVLQQAFLEIIDLERGCNDVFKILYTKLQLFITNNQYRCIFNSLHIRRGVSCGSVGLEGDATNPKVLVVTGGWGLDTRNTTEILYLDQNVWQKGPDIPFPPESEYNLGGARVAQYEDHLVITGGYSYISKEHVKTIFQLHKDLNWSFSIASLDTGRDVHLLYKIRKELGLCA